MNSTLTNLRNFKRHLCGVSCFQRFSTRKYQRCVFVGKKYCDNNPSTSLKDVIGNFLEYIQFHKIPANVLMREIHPLGLVPYNIIMNALAYQVQYPKFRFLCGICSFIGLFTYFVSLVALVGSNYLHHLPICTVRIHTP